MNKFTILLKEREENARKLLHEINNACQGYSMATMIDTASILMSSIMYKLIHELDMKEVADEMSENLSKLSDLISTTGVVTKNEIKH